VRPAVLTLARAIGHAARVPDPTSTWRGTPGDGRRGTRLWSRSRRTP